MRISAVILPFVIAAATVATCSWFSSTKTRVALGQLTPETALALPFEQRFNLAAVKQARDKATPADKEYAAYGYDYILSDFGISSVQPSLMDTLFRALQRYPSAELYLLLGYQNENDNHADLYYQWYKRYGEEWGDKRKATITQDSTAFFQQYGPDGTASEYFEMAGNLGQIEGWYKAATLYARQGKGSMAVERLNTALDNGFSDVPRFLNDSTFDPIRNQPDAIAFSTRLQQKYGEMATYYQKFKAAFPAVSLPLVLDSATKQGTVFADQFEPFVPEVTTEREEKFIGGMQRYNPPTYRYLAYITDQTRPYDLYIIDSNDSEGDAESRYVYISTYDKKGHRLSFYPVMLTSNYRFVDGSYGYSTIKVNNDFVINVESHNNAPEDSEAEDSPMRETVETQKITIGPSGKLVVEKSKK